MMQAPLAHWEIHVDRMYQAAVVPEQQIAEPPFVVIAVLGLGQAAMDPFEHVFAVLVADIDYPVRAVRIEVDGFSPSIVNESGQSIRPKSMRSRKSTCSQVSE